MAEKSQSHFKDWPNVAGFTTVEEQTQVQELQVKGQLPHAVVGVLYRTGPTNYILKDAKNCGFKFNHWFDGFSQVYRFQIIPEDSSCRVLFNSRRQTDKLVDHIRKTGKLDQITFGQKRDPCTSFFQKTKSVFKPSKQQFSDPSMLNAEVTIAPSLPTSGPEARNTLTSRTDTADMKEIDADTLEPIGVTTQQSLHPKLDGILSCAHAQFDPITGDCYNFNLAFGMSATYKIFCTSASTGKTEILATITGSDVQPAYLHSLFLSENYVILCIWTSFFAGAGTKILWERNLMDAISPFDPKAMTRWYVVDRKQNRGVVSTFKSPAMFAFHTINAFEVEINGRHNLYCDVIDYPNLDILHRLYYDNLISTGPGVAKFFEPSQRDLIQPTLSRFRLQDVLNKSEEPGVAERVIQIRSPDAGELPTINPHYKTKKSRFVYCLIDRGLSSFLDGIAKTDIESGEVKVWMLDKHTPGEAIFVPSPDGVAEDDGYLLSVVLNGNTGTSFLLCLDAKTMEEVGRAESEITIGLGFHGKHLGS